MKNVNITAARPTSPHIQIYSWPITMAMSIAHRITGVALYAGTILLAAWLIALAYNAQAFNIISSFSQNIIVRIFLFLYSLALVHHTVGGIRHLIWDVKPNLLEKHLATKTATATIYISIIVTIFIWLMGYLSH
ncbi:succinate dehydrogenase, cytochrome b556 subunit [Bartonella sp. TP]|uniref:succinate dehydrogenase, cytochrome b556 subunit n=1 Tax=Bartonella sp. TP TaxID=3057550 RepID=UPI0025AFB748|nr:succinate dehydrogenase, cytochrome b556 subunit [Bartonella sp. TP]MDN5248520.1 succinate dehydrogenase, cytochrome b556 subunit [Alphaproteobacteria bacterium]WJW79556.1 succinate dehydrogenase, cytochrome b556 subunit [Bartonella sp. TP]